MSNGDMPATMPAQGNSAQPIAALVTAVDGLARQIEELLQQASGARNDIRSNQDILRIINGEVGDLATAIRLTLDRLPAPDALAPRTELAELAARISAAHRQEGVLVAQFGGLVHAVRSDTERRIGELAHTYQAVISEMLLRLPRRFGEETSTEDPGSS
jgi:hypothetical protein